MKQFSYKLLIFALALSFIGCTQVSRQMGSITDNKYAKARSGTTWVVPPPQLEPPSDADRTVFISYRNISDADIDLRDLLREAAQEQGWRVINDPEQAKYRLRASTRFFGEVDPDSGGAGVGAAMGSIAGAAVGVGTGVAVARSTNRNAAGWVAGGLAGGLVAAGLNNSSRPREWAMIVDVVLEEQTRQPVQFEMATESGTGASDSVGAANSRMASGGGTSSATTTGATVTRTSNYFPHGIRLAVWANQMNMKEEEAMPEIESRARRVVTQMLPM